MAPGWARTIGNKNTVHFHWLLQACRQNSSPLNFLQTGILCMLVAWLESLSGPVVSVSPHLAAGAHLRIRRHCRKLSDKHHRLCYRSHDGSQSKYDCIQTGQGSSTAPWAPVWFLLQPQLFISVLLPLLSLVTWAGGRSSRVWAFLKLFGKSYWEGSLKLLEIMALLFQENYKSCVPQSQRKVTKWPRHKTQFWVSSALGTARS